jgi:hypothetical protein
MGAIITITITMTWITMARPITVASDATPPLTTD